MKMKIQRKLTRFYLNLSVLVLNTFRMPYKLPTMSAKKNGILAIINIYLPSMSHSIGSTERKNTQP